MIRIMAETWNFPQPLVTDSSTDGNGDTYRDSNLGARID